MIFIILIIIFLLYLYGNKLIMIKDSHEPMCDIEYPICDNFCQRAKWEVCLARQRRASGLSY